MSNRTIQLAHLANYRLMPGDFVKHLCSAEALTKFSMQEIREMIEALDGELNYRENING